MRTIEVKKGYKCWYVKVWNEDGSLHTMAGFSTKATATRVKERWIREKAFGEIKENKKGVDKSTPFLYNKDRSEEERKTLGPTAEVQFFKM